MHENKKTVLQSESWQRLTDQTYLLSGDAEHGSTIRTVL